MNKPWYKSLTIISLLILAICIIIDYLLGNYGPTEIFDKIHQVTQPVEGAATFTTVIGLRRAVGVNDENAKPPPMGETK